jgi:hypothetical protein
MKTCIGLDGAARVTHRDDETCLYCVREFNPDIADCVPVPAPWLDALTSEVAQGIAGLREFHPDITDEQIQERARNIVQALVGNYVIIPVSS